MTMISVIIPTYNRAHTLRRAINSVLKQSFRDFELLVVDDGSTDETAKLIGECNDTRLSYCYQENRGVSAARNSGIEKARGEWLCFLDSDDEWKERKLEKQVAFHDRYPDILISQTEEIWIRNGKHANPRKKHEKERGMIYEKSLPLCLISPSSVMIHQSVFETIGLFNENYPACEDYELWLRLTCRYAVGLVTNKLIIKYGGHQDQLSHTIPSLDIFRIRAMITMLDSGLLSKNQYIATQQELKKKCLIYANGCKKRGKAKEATQYINYAKQYSQ